MRKPTDVSALLSALGIAARQRGTKWIARCPNPAHDDRSPSWFIRDDAGSRAHCSHLCQSCGFGGGAWELVAAVRGCSLDEAAAFVRALSSNDAVAEVHEVGVVVPRRVAYRLPPGVEFGPLDAWPDAHRKYLERRGVTPHQVEKWGIGYARRGPLAWRVVVPVYTSGALRAYSARAIFDDGSARYDMPVRDRGARPDRAIWGEPGWSGERCVVLCEGVFSGLSLERAGARAVGAMLGSQVVPKLAALCSALERAGADRVIIATDPDPAGNRAADELEVALSRRYDVVRADLAESPDDYQHDDLRAVLESVGYDFLN